MTQSSRARLFWEILFSGAAAVWFIGIPLAASTLLAVVIPSSTGIWRQLAFILFSGGFQIGGLLIVVAVCRLGSHCERAALLGRALALISGWLVIRGVVQVLLPDRPTWAAAAELALALPYVLGLGGLIAGQAQKGKLAAGWRHMGLGRSGALGWGLAAAALILWPWFIVGALGDAGASAEIAFQSLVGGAVTEWLWRGLALSVLLSITNRRWAAGILGAVLYTAYELANLALGQSDIGLWQALDLYRPGPVGHRAVGPIRQGQTRNLGSGALSLTIPRPCPA